MKLIVNYITEKLKLNKDSKSFSKELIFVDDCIEFLYKKPIIQDIFKNIGGFSSIRNYIYKRVSVYLGVYDNTKKEYTQKERDLINLEQGNLESGDFYIVLYNGETESLKTKLDGHAEFIELVLELAKLYYKHYDNFDVSVKMPEKEYLEELIEAGKDKDKIRNILYQYYNDRIK